MDKLPEDVVVELRSAYSQLGEVDYHLEIVSQQMQSLQKDRTAVLKTISDIQQRISEMSTEEEDVKGKKK